MEFFKNIGGTKMIIGIHQPNFLPWLGYLYKIWKSDIFVFLDNVQYTKNSFINRNKIKTSLGSMWLTIPVSFKFGDLIKEVRISDKVDWRKKHLKTLEMNYKKARYFSEVFKLIKSVYYLKKWNYLIDLNIEIIKNISTFMNLDTKYIKASALNLEGESTELLVSIIKKLKGNIYLSGFGGKKYQEEELFKKNGIILVYYDFIHPFYEQLWGNFIPNLSIIDLVFNYGSKSIDIFSQGGNK